MHGKNQTNSIRLASKCLCRKISTISLASQKPIRTELMLTPLSVAPWGGVQHLTKRDVWPREERKNSCTKILFVGCSRINERMSKTKVTK